MHIGQVVKTLRVSRGLSINRLAALSTVSKGQISNLEAGLVNSPGAETLAKLAKALGHESAAIFFDPDVLKPEQTTVLEVG